MTRSAGRWLALTILAAAVVALAFYNSLSNRSLIEGLTSGDPASFEDFALRQDAYIFLQSEPTSVRLRVAQMLGDWHGANAAKLAVLLVPDPDPNVRKQLAASLGKIASRDPDAIADEFSASGAAESAALIEAAASDPAVGIEILRKAIKANPSGSNAYLLAKRIGLASKDILIPLVDQGDETATLASIDALLSFDLAPNEQKRIADVLLSRYEGAESQRFKDKLLPSLSALAPREAATVFEQVALDKSAPTDLRVAATTALRTLDVESLEQLKQDADTAVAAAANGA